MFNFLLQGKVGEMMAPVQSQEAQLLIAIQNRQQDKIQELLEVKGVGANNANDRGVRPMHIACQTGNSHLVQRLLELGADIVTPDKAGNTPLHYASKGGHTEMVKMLVGQGAAVEQRNSSKLTAYDVATDHVIRQFLLPLQLKAEAGNPDYAVNQMGITSDAPRNYEQYGVPGTGGAPSCSQPYGHQMGGGGGAAGGSHSMDDALGALMQAPSMVPLNPRPGGMGPQMGMATPAVYSGAGGGGYPGSTPPQQPGSYSPPGDGGGAAAAGFLARPPAAAAAAPAAAVGAPPPAAAASLPPFDSPAGSVSPPGPFPGATVAVTSTTVGVSSPSLAAEASPLQPPAPPAAGPGDSAPSLAHPPAGEVGLATPTKAGSGSPQAAAAAAALSTGGGPGTSAGVAVQLAPSPNSGAAGPAAAAGRSPAASPRATGAGTGAARSTPSEENSVGPRGATAVAAKNSSGDSSLMSTVDLSSRFQAQATVSGGVAEGSFVGGSSRSGTTGLPPPPPTSAPNSATSGAAPRPSRPPGAYTPGPGPNQVPAEQVGSSSTFKLIKPDGFHSSASDPALQEMYGHTKITRDYGAPPTAAQLGGAGPPPTGGGPMGGPLPMPRQPPYNGYSQQAHPRPQHAAPHQQAGGGQRNFGQPFGGGGGGMGSGGMQQPAFGQQQQQQQQQQQSYGQALPGAAFQALPPPGAPSSGGVALPTPSGYVQRPAAGDFAPPPPSIPPATTTVVAADSTSNAVL